MKSNLIVVPHKLRNALLRDLAEYKIVFLSAGAGWGKGTAVREFLKERARSAAYVSVEDGRIPRLCAKEPLVILDDFQNLSPQYEKRMAEIIRRSPKRQRLILLSRGSLPDILLPYRFSGELRLLTAEELALTSEDVAQIANSRGISLSASDLLRIQHETHGYPPYIFFLLDLLPASGLCLRAVESAQRLLYAYFDTVLFAFWDKPTRKVLLSSSYFQIITVALVEAVLEDANGGEVLLRISRSTGILQEEAGDVWRYSDPGLVGPYLRWKAERELTSEEIRRLHMLGGDWCAGRGDYAGAVQHYDTAGNRPAVVDTLIQAVRRDGSPWTLCQLSDRLRDLTIEEIRGAPELSFAMCRVSRLYLDPEREDFFRHVLEKQAAGPEPAQALRYLSFLDPCSLSRDSSALKAGNQKLQPPQKENPLSPAVHLTCGLPSVLRGERDLSALMLRPSDAAGAPLRQLISALTGGRTESFQELLQIEYQLEQGKNVTASLLQWHPLQLRIREQGALELEFVCVALTVRSLCSEGQFSEAESYLLRFRQRAEAERAHVLLGNIDAVRCRISLMEDSVYAARWLADQPPTGGIFSLLDGYRLFTRVRCHIKRGEYQTALLFLGQMLAGYRRCGRTLDQMEALILAAICCDRMGEENWREHLRRALSLGAHYSFVEVFAREGAALMPLLESHLPDESISSPYWCAIMRRTMKQAGLSPAYLRPARCLAQPLTPAEHTVLILLMRRKSTGEMGRVMGIKVSTVRTHLRHLFSKLGVHSQEEAREAAVRLNLIQ